MKLKLQDAVLVESFSQNQRELVFGFSLVDQSDFYFKGLFDADFSCLEFRGEFPKSQKYSQNLYKEVVGSKVCDVVQTKNDRSFRLIFDNGYSLFFKLYGRRSNVLLLNDSGGVEKLFNYKLKKDYELDLKAIDRELNVSLSNYLEQGVSGVFPMLSKTEKRVLELKETNTEDDYIKIKQLIDSYESSRFYICQNNGELFLTLFPFGEVVEYYSSAIEAVSRFFQIYVGPYFFQKKKEVILSSLNAKYKSLNNYYKKSFRSYEKVSSQRSKREIADVIMANLHEIPNGVESVELFDFYQNEKVSIALKKNLSPQKYAEQLYRKEKNRSIEVRKLEENLEVAESRLKKLQSQIDAVKEVWDSKELKKLEKLINQEVREKVGKSNFKTFEYKGYQIIIGRNSSNNDEVTKSARKDDLWLHAKDVQGSHVVIRKKGNDNFPKDVIERAASIAAFYSKRKTDTLCPVIVTPKKFVRKVKGAPKGAVMVDREEVVLIEPMKE